MKIDQIMPKAVSRFHHIFVNKLKKTGYAGKLFNKDGIEVFVIKKDGYIYLMRMNTQVIYTFEFGYVFMIAFWKQKNF